MTRPIRQRNPAQTSANLLAVAIREFAAYGFDGARVERIVQEAGCNMRMLYHYYGNKENLYTQALESVYREIRDKESGLDLAALPPDEALLRLVRFTWDHLSENKVFIDITRNENLVGGRFIRSSKAIAKMSSPLLLLIADTIRRGLKAGVFQYDADPLQLYISIVALSSHHMSNVHTLSAVFQTDIADPKWLRQRRTHVETMVCRMLGFTKGPAAKVVKRPGRR
ncbi:TetR/AcrR family transcriptional regulator [Ferrovibrio terrae]|uniref:TetR/AcrR family transcriptional regulator n=1 Tax=Ferrovibrio terrae TaxID=2594003 RepID=UPI0031380732